MKLMDREIKKSIKRCVAYIRVSTEEQAVKDFSSLDSQKERIQSFAELHRSEGWRVTEVYEDPGFSAKDTNRPAMKQMMRDASEGKFDAILVYKLDRFSRSVKDGATMIDFLNKRNIDFVSVTQSFNTGTPEGRMMLNMMLSTGQWEREINSARTKDKIQAERGKGFWTGGYFPLGYDSSGTKVLKTNPDEAEQVCEMFRVYLEQQSLDRAMEIINKKYHSKIWTTKKGHKMGGEPFSKTTYLHILRNPIYIGKVRCASGLVDGQQEAIVNPKVFENVEKLLARNYHHQNSVGKNKHEFILKGLLWCDQCGTPMTTYHPGGIKKRYSYYRCESTSKRGYNSCPVKWVRADDIEKFIIERLAFLWENPSIIETALLKAQEQTSAILPKIQRHMAEKRKDVQRIQAEAERLMDALGQGSGNSLIREKLDQLDQRKKQLDFELVELQGQLIQAKERSVDAVRFRQVLACFGEKFNSLGFLDRQKLLRLVVKRIDFNKARNEVRLALYPLTGKKPAGMGTPPDVRQVCHTWLPIPDTADEGVFSLKPNKRKTIPFDLAFCIIDKFSFTTQKKGRWGGTKLIPDFKVGAA